jgi:hypothetical protein
VGDWLRRAPVPRLRYQWRREATSPFFFVCRQEAFSVQHGARKKNFPLTVAIVKIFATFATSKKKL